MKRNRVPRRNYFKFNHLRAAGRPRRPSGNWKGVLPFICLPGAGRRRYLPPMIARRQLIFGSALVGPLVAAHADGAAHYKAIAFDGFPIIDPRPVALRAEALFPGRGGQLMEGWRTRQFEYTWLRTLSGRYADFWQVTQDSPGGRRRGKRARSHARPQRSPDADLPRTQGLAGRRARARCVEGPRRPHDVPGQPYGRDARGADAQRRARGIAGGAAQHRSRAGLQAAIRAPIRWGSTPSA